jgi:argininosuccinate lyase
MPQKKNPEVLEIIRARASYALGDLVASAALIKSLPSTYNLDFQEVTPKLWASTDNLSASLGIFAKLIPDLKVTDNIENKAAAGFVGATELANLLVRKYNVAFRTSHKIVGSLVKALINTKQTLLDATPEILQKVAQESASIKLTVKKQDLIECTNPRKLVETYKVQGGPSPAEVERAIAVKSKTLKQTLTFVVKLQESLANAENTLNLTVESYVSKSSKNGRLKNPKL